MHVFLPPPFFKFEILAMPLALNDLFLQPALHMWPHLQFLTDAAHLRAMDARPGTGALFWLLQYALLHLLFTISEQMYYFNFSYNCVLEARNHSLDQKPLLQTRCFVSVRTESFEYLQTLMGWSQNNALMQQCMINLTN